MDNWFTGPLQPVPPNARKRCPVLSTGRTGWVVCRLVFEVISKFEEKLDVAMILKIIFIWKYVLCYLNIMASLWLCPPPWGVDILFLLFSPSDVRCPLSDVRCPMSGVRRPMSGVTHGFRSFKGKVLELLSPNLVCRLIGSVACLGLLLAVVPLLLTE